MPLQTGYVEQGLKDQLNIYTSVQLHSIRKNRSTSNLDKHTCSKIKELGIKKFSGEREEENTGQNTGPKQRYPQQMA